MELLSEYINGNFTTRIYDDGTKIRENDEDFFLPAFAESADVKITNYCDVGCAFCHEKSTTKGAHGDILNSEFINSVHPYTELAIGGGNPLSHPDLVEFLKLLKNKNIISNLTVNQTHFIESYSFLKELSNQKLIYGLGVSLTNPTDELIGYTQNIPNIVVHVINGVVTESSLEKMYNKNLKLLILGYKNFGRGEDYYSQEVESKKAMLYNLLPKLTNRFSVVSFDNLAVTQLNVKRLLSEKKWNEFYMGDDGQYTMYIDMVKNQFARSSTSTKRYKTTNNIDDMFKVIRSE